MCALCAGPRVQPPCVCARSLSVWASRVRQNRVDTASMHMRVPNDSPVLANANALGLLLEDVA